MKYQDAIRSQHIQIGKLDIHYFTGGHGDPVVVVHGGGAGADSWIEEAIELARNYTVYIPDLPGFGLSPRMGEKFVMDEYISFIEEFVTSLGLIRFNLVGHSLGGGIAGDYALHHPERVNKLVLVSSVGLGKEISIWARLACWSLSGISRNALRAARWIAGRFSHHHESLAVLSGFAISIGLALMNLEGQKISLVSQLSTLLVPTLLIWGARDNVVPVAHGYAASRIIPHCEIKVFDDCGHSVYQQAHDFCRVLARFFG